MDSGSGSLWAWTPATPTLSTSDAAPFFGLGVGGGPAPSNPPAYLRVICVSLYFLDAVLILWGTMGLLTLSTTKTASSLLGYTRKVPTFPRPTCLNVSPSTEHVSNSKSRTLSSPCPLFFLFFLFP